MRLSILGGVEHDTRTADLEIQDRVRWSRNHELDLGVGARLISFSFDPLYERSWTKVEPGTRRETLFSTHAQDRWQVTEKTSITASAKAEFWSLIGNSAQISAVLRGNYRPTDRTQFWTALSRNLANPSYREVAVEMWVAQVPPYWAYVAGGVPEGYRLDQCLFGEHLLHRYPDAPVGIVEAEKTALVARLVVPDILWIATGSLDGLTRAKALPLVDRHVTLWPDLGKGHEEWSAKAPDLEPLFASLTVADLLEHMATPEQCEDGMDLADFLLPDHPATAPPPKPG